MNHIVKQFNNQYTKAKIDGTVVTFRSRFEYRYARYLDLLKTQGHILRWDYEGKLGICQQPTFYFKDVETAPVQYTPDFWIEWAKTGTEYHETKGFLQKYDISKFKRMWEQYEDTRLVLIFMQKPKLSAIRRGKLERYCHRVIWNAGSSIFTKEMKVLINW